eukprot:TRINITY_DN9726_c0_g1_i1.p1 TRINITY_DN9726_c0_g1~~TRINITY_DN9726_c0_g1_i1.p1  ORF type:complete len:759 (-),score=161.84 TRINITY_DN9726_c0_g1_i1:161-2437(-)
MNALLAFIRPNKTGRAGPQVLKNQLAHVARVPLVAVLSFVLAAAGATVAIAWAAVANSAQATLMLAPVQLLSSVDQTGEVAATAAALGLPSDTDQASLLQAIAMEERCGGAGSNGGCGSMNLVQMSAGFLSRQYRQLRARGVGAEAETAQEPLDPLSFMQVGANSSGEHAGGTGGVDVGAGGNNRTSGLSGGGRTVVANSSGEHAGGTGGVGVGAGGNNRTSGLSGGGRTAPPSRELLTLVASRSNAEPSAVQAPTGPLLSTVASVTEPPLGMQPSPVVSPLVRPTAPQGIPQPPQPPPSVPPSAPANKSRTQVNPEAASSAASQPTPVATPCPTAARAAAAHAAAATDPSLGIAAAASAATAAAAALLNLSTLNSSNWPDIAWRDVEHIEPELAAKKRLLRGTLEGDAALEEEAAQLLWSHAGALVMVLVVMLSMLVMSFSKSMTLQKDVRGEQNESMDHHHSPTHQAVAALPVCSGEEVKAMCAKATSNAYDCAFVRPWTSKKPLRFQARVEGASLENSVLPCAPLSLRDCLVYSVSISERQPDGTKGACVASAGAGVDFFVSMLDAPDVRIEVGGFDAVLFDNCGGRMAALGPLEQAPEHWRDFAERYRNDVEALSQPITSCGEEFEFEENALFVGSTVTLVGELQRRVDGRLVLQPWHDRTCQADNACEPWRTSWEMLADSDQLSTNTDSASLAAIPSLQPLQSLPRGRVLISDALDLLRPPSFASTEVLATEVDCDGRPSWRRFLWLCGDVRG